MVRFPAQPMYQGFQRPSRFEGDIYDVEVIQGEVPIDLQGACYRVGPDPQFGPKLGEDIPLNGDGMVTRFWFEDGRVDFRCRYVRTPKFLAERAAGRALFGAYRNPFTDDASVKGLPRGTANTNILWHGGRMFALKEDSHPVEIDPLTLETFGPWDYDGRLHSVNATAHPKIDPRTGALVFFSYAARGETTPDIAYYEADTNGNVIFERWLQAPYSSMVHDFCVTENHIVFPIIPLISDLERLKEGLPHFAWNPSKPMYLGVLPRLKPDAPPRWYMGESRFASHMMNAYEDNGKLHIDTSVGDSVAFPFFPPMDGSPFDPVAAIPYVSRWTIDLDAKTNDFTQQQVSDIPGEFPRIDERRATEDYRFGFICMQGPSEGLPGSLAGFRFNLIGRIDHRDGGATTTYDVGPDAATQEPLFVPRPGSTQEGDGYLLALINRFEDMRSDLVILDAQNVGGEPLATLALPFRLRNGLHATWVEADHLARYRAPERAPV